MIDLVPYFMMPSVAAGNKLANGQVYSRETHHLEGTTLTGAAAEFEYHVLSQYSMKFVKGPQGWPVEAKPYDSQFIYDLTTENGWLSAQNFKKFNPPVPMFPRIWDGNPWAGPLLSPPNKFEIWQGCKLISTQDLGAIYYELSPMVNVDFGGDVGLTATIPGRFFWGGTKPPLLNREELYLTARAGWAFWTHANLVGNVYEIDAATLHNKIVAGGPPAIQFPCITIP